MTREWYMHPNGQIPAYEWAFGDVNPPVHAWAALRVFQIDRKQRGAAGDLEFLERVFHKLMLNFTWWVNRKDAEGRNVFQGGFLGLDNIGVFDRSAELPTGGHIDQADGTSWMAMYALNLMRIALELARHNRVYEDIATKFFEHFLHIAEAMSNIGEQGIGLWDPADEFFYDVLHLPDDSKEPLKLRSMVGLIPLFAVETLEPEMLDALPDFKRRLEWFLNYRPELAALVSDWNVPGRGHRRLLSLLRGHRMKRILKRMLDETEFLSAHGVRSLSRIHAEHPYVFRRQDMELTVSYQPAESDTRLFGGNSNWRGPVWFPVNFLIIESLQKFAHYYGDDFKVECPAGSGELRHAGCGRARARGAADAHFSQKRAAAGVPYTARMSACSTTRTFAITCFSTSTSTGTRVVASALPTKPAGRGSWRSSSCRATHMMNTMQFPEAQAALGGAGRIIAGAGCPVVNADLSVAGIDRLWAVGDCAGAVNARDGTVSPPTAQCAEAAARRLALNIVARLKGAPTHPFRYHPKGQLSSMGHNNAVAEIFGVRVCGFIAWLSGAAYICCACRLLRASVCSLNGTGPCSSPRISRTWVIGARKGTLPRLWQVLPQSPRCRQRALQIAAVSARGGSRRVPRICS